jgi:hypothetical protein
MMRVMISTHRVAPCARTFAAVLVRECSDVTARGKSQDIGDELFHGHALLRIGRRFDAGWGEYRMMHRSAGTGVIVSQVRVTVRHDGRDDADSTAKGHRDEQTEHNHLRRSVGRDKGLHEGPAEQGSRVAQRFHFRNLIDDVMERGGVPQSQLRRRNFIDRLHSSVVLIHGRGSRRHFQ